MMKMETHVKLAIGLVALSVLLVVNANEPSETKVKETENSLPWGVNEHSKRDIDESVPNLEDSRAEASSVVKGLAKLVAGVIGAAIFVIIVCIICCCCCPFCLLAKRKERGRVLRTNAFEAARPTQPIHNAGAIQPGYAIPPEQYQQMPPQQPYPPVGFNQSLPHSAPYPTNQGAPQGYAMDQPPPYPGPPIQPYPGQQGGGQVNEAQLQNLEYQKQPAYNPSAPQ